MTITDFTASLNTDTPPPHLPNPLLALWRDARGDWNDAHHLVQDDPSADAAWIHAYLHRKDGDTANAHYWYRRANRPIRENSPDDEWLEITTSLLTRAADKKA